MYAPKSRMMNRASTDWEDRFSRLWLLQNKKKEAGAVLGSDPTIGEGDF
jgi:hypothetical protein